MFSGIIRALGSVRERIVGDAGLRLAIDMPLDGVGLGDSIAVNGICLTVCELDAAAHFDLSPETLARTLAGDWQVGEAVNLEPALTLADKLDGHLVFGHVDGTAELVDLRSQGECVELRFGLPAESGLLVAEKGSIALDGIGLTVNTVHDSGNICECSVMLVPHTLAATTAKNWQPGRRVHAEFDMLARYVARQLEGRAR